ncbi:MAG: chromosome segregation SMC family protein, partial [Candidatus Aenigmatarchaeota archaeon]
MVRLKKLEMRGFKSFASKTEVPLPSGFNAICGPNGSGKSNIADAITFALGTLSTKSIRAGKLEDLIYNGTKKDVNQAEVTLIIDNKSGEINIDDDRDDIKITRKINKSGNSIYKLNGKTATRKRITNILSNARIQPDGHNIIMQGDITQLIEMNSEERREIIDEISGIAEFDDKREQAEKELEKVDNKLKEARIVLNEKKNNLEKLKNEKKNAERYKNLEEELEKLKTSILYQRLDEKQEEADEIREKFEKKQEKFEEINEKYEDKDEKLEELQDEEEKIRKEMIEKGKNQELVQDLQEIKSKIETKRNKIESHDREIDRIDKAIEKLKSIEKQKQAFTGKGAVKEIMKLGKSGVEGTIASLANVKDKYQTPIEVAAGSRLNNIVVKDDKVASDCIKHLKKNRAGRATFLPLNKIRPRDKSREAKRLLNKDGVIDFAINLIDYSSKYELAFRYVFQDTLIVEDLDTARKYMGKARMVTLDGDIIHKSGAMVGGQYKSKKGKQTKLSGSDKSDEIDEYEEEKRDLKEEIEILRKEIGSLNERLDELNDKREEESGEMDELEEKQEEIKEEIDKVRKERKKLYEKKTNLQNKVGKLNVEKAKIEATLENLNNEMESEEDEMDIYEEDLEVLEKRRKDTLNDMNQLGPVNMRALDEYKNVKTVYDTLKGKVDKISEEKNAILDTVKRIEERRENTFMETFETVNENFQEIFHEITKGDGSLELEEGGNIRSGLIIKARPKGKETLNLDSMSGGEKAVTALSFLFAVQRYKPAPFYILDEIDAALDDKNTKKISSLIKKYS